MSEKEIITNLKKCHRFECCSMNLCPLDSEAYLRKGEDENRCPFTINNKRKTEKGIKTLASTSILEVIPECNLKMLNNRNQKRWHDLKRTTITIKK